MEIVAALVNGTPEQKEMAQESLNRWWWPALMMFGPHDTDSPNSGELMKWRVKMKTNDELRQRFVNMTVEQARAFGLSIPDPHLRYNEETRQWETGEIDWEEFRLVVNGSGPCNRERLEARRKAHRDGAWVREAARAHEGKRLKGGQAAA
jgi:ring-1,2-phenylacetyl-CoA epoxidase subunit PaaA